MALKRAQRTRDISALAPFQGNIAKQSCCLFLLGGVARTGWQAARAGGSGRRRTSAWFPYLLLFAGAAAFTRDASHGQDCSCIDAIGQSRCSCGPQAWVSLGREAAPLESLGLNVHQASRPNSRNEALQRKQVVSSWMCNRTLLGKRCDASFGLLKLVCKGLCKWHGKQSMHSEDVTLGQAGKSQGIESASRRSSFDICNSRATHLRQRRHNPRMRKSAFPVVQPR